MEETVHPRDSDYIPDSFDLCLVLECTGTMQPYIDAVRNKVIVVLEEIKQKYPTCKVQIGLTTYRDVNEKARPKVLDYTDNFKKAGNFLKALDPEGGNPGPKDVSGGFHRGLYKLLVVSQASLTVHIGTAPCHGKDYHSLENDDFPGGFKKDVAWKLLIKDLIGMGRNYLFLKVSSDTDQMFAKLKEIGENTAPDHKVIFKQEPLCKGGPIAVAEEPKEEVKKDTGAKKGKATKSEARKEDSESPERSKEREEGVRRSTRQTKNVTKEKERSNSRERKKSPKGKGAKESSGMMAEKMALSKEDQEYFGDLLKNTIIECMEKKREELRLLYESMPP